jgi:multiple sugar transport system permease protein
MNRRLKEGLIALLYILPAIVVLLSFRVLPIILAVRTSFFDWTMAGTGKFVYLQNYIRVLHDPVFWKSLLNTFWYILFSVPLMIAISLFIAVLLNQKIRGLGVYRTIYYLPVVTSIIAVSVVWKWIFNPDRGLLNYVLSWIHVSNIRWLEDPRGLFEVIFGATNLPDILKGPSIALLSLAIMAIWKGLGYNVVIFLAGLLNVPVQYYEAAKIDGAGPWRIFRSVTWPMLSPTTFYVLIMTTIVSFDAFAPVWIMTGPPAGGPLNTTKVVMYYFFEQSFEVWKLGYGAAIAFFSFLIIMTLTIIQRTVIEKRVHYG